MTSIFAPKQLALFSQKELSPSPAQAKRNGRSGSFVDNMKLPVHRWFRYSAGFSAEWVRELIRSRQEKADQLTVLDPFAGVGTTLLACNAEGAKSFGFEMHPFIFQVAGTKLDALTADLSSTKSFFEQFFRDASARTAVFNTDQPALLLKCYTDDTLARLDLLKELYIANYASEAVESRLVWLAITSILRVSSSVGTAQWQYVLPNKAKVNVREPFGALKMKFQEIVDDIAYAQEHGWRTGATLLETDARKPNLPTSEFVDMVVTSPPYPNNYDYADATRLEMTFWGDVASWKDLHSAVRNRLLVSCSQHAAAERLTLESLLDSDLLTPIRDDLAEACFELAEVRLTKGGRKTYHTMAAAYFNDMAQVFQALRPICHSGSELCFVIGDSAPYGVYLSVDEWLGQLALAVGFSSFRFEKLRDRNVKWKNRKHRVPLKEGRLWIRG